jgi:hypothetical protein
MKDKDKIEFFLFIEEYPQLHSTECSVNLEYESNNIENEIGTQCTCWVGDKIWKWIKEKRKEWSK